MNRLRCLLLTLCVVTLLIAPLYGQKTTGALIGTVTDPSGAVVASAPVVVSDTATGATRSVTTDDQGVYSVPELQPGTYKVNVKAANFKESVVNAVEIHVATTATLNIKLQLGKASEQIEVEANAVQVQTDSAALGSVVDSTQVKELPLNGRNFMGLTQLAPGVSFGNSFNSKDKGLAGGSDLAINGNAVTNNLFLVDGANNNDVGSNRTILTYPAVESIDEFKLLQNAYGPEYGQASGGVVNLVTKSGTNQFHGSVFYNGRNDALNSWEYFAKQNGTKGKLRRNDYGFTLGGPAWKDKLFFFYSQEWNKEIRGRSYSSCVPTEAERNGDFSNPSCSAALPNIPVDAQDPNNKYKVRSDLVSASAAHYLLAKIPTPNLPTSVSGNNWAISAPSKLNWRQENARVDFKATKNHTAMFRYNQDNWDNPAKGTTGWGDDPFPALNSNWSQPSKMIIGKVTSTIGNSIVNDVEFSYSNNRINITPNSASLLQTLSSGFPTLYPSSLKNQKYAVPTVSGFNDYLNTTVQMEAPWSNALDLYNLRDDISKVMGSHTFKFGFLTTWNSKDEDTSGPGAEHIAFTANNTGLAPAAMQLTGFETGTGNTLANLMIPQYLFNLNETSTNIRSMVRWRDHEFYFGDTWKARKNLTLEYGVRYSLLLSPYQPNGKATGFVPSLYDPTKSASDACNGLWTVPGKDPCGDANKLYGTSYSTAATGPNKYLRNQNYHLFAPRLGVSYDPTGKGDWAIRAGIGQFFQRDRVTPMFALTSNAPFAVSISNYGRTLTGATPSSVGGSGKPSGGWSASSMMPNSWQWNLSVEHSFAKETTVQVGYVGNRAIHQLISYDINIPDPSNWLAGAFMSDISSLRPYSNYNQLNYWDHSGDANYHSLQAQFKTRYKRSQLTAAYTWSHSISTVQLDDSSGGTGQQSFHYYKDPGLDRGNSPINRPHMFIANATYFFPELKGSKGLVRNTLGGWELTGITTAQSGHSLTIQQGGISENPNLLAAGSTPSTLNNLVGVSLNGMITPLTTGSSCSGSGKQLYSPQAFTLIGYKIGTIPSGTEGRGYCLGPHFVNTDLSINKNWSLTEKVKMQFRLDLFDLFNHPNFGANSLQSGTPFTHVNCGPAVSGLYQPCSPTNNVIGHQDRNSNFGIANGTIGNAGRELQYGLKISF